MRKFIQRALAKLEKLDMEQIYALVSQIAKENEQLEMVLDSMTDGVIVLDRSHRVIQYNKAAERVLPVVPGELEEKPVWTVVDDNEVAEFFHVSLENQDKFVDKEFTIDSGGQARVLTCSSMPLVQGGEIQGTLLHIEDITERRSKEARLHRAESLASLTTLAAGMAHEIKNPLGSIGIHIQLIQRTMASPKRLDRKTVNHYLEIITEEVERLNGIVVDFLFAVRPMDAHPEESDINKLLEDLLEFVHFELEEGGVEIVSELNDDLPALEFDEKLMKQALLNIINNAVAAMPDGGSLTVATERKGEVVLVHVKDSGTGISDENMAKIFEPYFTTKDFGSGLGLTVVYKIVKEHGGEIAVKSKAGEGTTFTISLPIPMKELRLLGWKGKKA